MDLEAAHIVHLLFEPDINLIALGQRCLKLVKLLSVERQLRMNGEKRRKHGRQEDLKEEFPEADGLPGRSCFDCHACLIKIWFWFQRH